MTLAQLYNESDASLLKSLDLKITDFENGLNVYQDNRGNWFYNLNQTTKFEIDESLLLEYTCTYDSHWPLIAYNIYGSARLAWMLMRLNNVTTANVFQPIFAGQKIKYIDKAYLRTIINSFQDYNK